jgi:small multidrug resistance pump
LFVADFFQPAHGFAIELLLNGSNISAVATNPFPLTVECAAVHAGGMNWIYLSIAIVSEVVATSFLKLTDGFTRPLPSVAVVLGYASAFYFLSQTLRTIPVGVAYAVWSGVGIVLVAAIGWLIYGQKLDLPGILGMALIIAGIVVLNLFSKVSTHG